MTEQVYRNSFDGITAFPVPWVPIQAGAWSIANGQLIYDGTVGADYVERKSQLAFTQLGKALYQRYVVRHVIADGASDYHIRGVAARLQALGPVASNTFYAMGVRINRNNSGSANKLEIECFAHDPGNNFQPVGSGGAVSATAYGATTEIDCEFIIAGANPTTITINVRDASTQALMLTFTGQNSLAALQQPGYFALNSWNWGDLEVGQFPREEVTIHGEDKREPRTPDVFRTATGIGWSTEGDAFEVERGGAVVATVTGAKVYPTAVAGTYRVRAKKLLSFTGGFVADGDSITLGQGATMPFPAVLAEITGWAATNLGVSGRTLADMNATYASRGVGALYNATSRNTLLLHGGINDILFTGGMTLATLQANTIAYCGKAKASGFRVIVLTALGDATITGAQETLRLAFNAWLRTSWPEYCDGLADVASIPELAPTPVVGLWWLDEAHPSNPAHILIANTVLAQTLAPIINPMDAYGPELLLNSTFNATVTSWPATTGSITWDASGALSAGNGSSGRATQPVTVIPARNYGIRAEVKSGANGLLRFGEDLSGVSGNVLALTNLTVGSFSYVRAATASAMALSVGCVSGTAVFDNMSLREIMATGPNLSVLAVPARCYRTASENVIPNIGPVTSGKRYRVTGNVSLNPGTTQAGLRINGGSSLSPAVGFSTTFLGAFDYVFTALTGGTLSINGDNTGTDMTFSALSLREVT